MSCHSSQAFLKFSTTLQINEGDRRFINDIRSNPTQCCEISQDYVGAQAEIWGWRSATTTPELNATSSVNFMLAKADHL